MMEANFGAGAFRFDNPQQEHIYRRLQSIGPGPAVFYRDVCKIMAAQPQLESTSHLVSHLLREIESALRDALEPIGAWQKKTTHREEILQILNGLDIPESDPLAQAWLALSRADNEYGLAKRAHRDSLAPPRPNDAAFREFVAQFELVLGAVLSRMDVRFATNFTRIDQVLALPETPEEKLARFANALPNNPVVVEHLLEQIAALNDPAWLEPLEAQDYFRHPPPAERSFDEVDGTASVRYPRWPQSRFLVHMARTYHGQPAAERVARIAVGIPETDNAAINEDLVMVALNMSPGLGAQLAPSIGRAVEWSASGFLPEHIAELVVTLVRGGETEAAFALARRLLEVHAVEVAPLELGDEVLQFSPNVHGFYDDWMYERVIDRLAPVLAEEQEEAALDLICNLLDDAIAKSKRPDDPGPPIDLSTHWWPALDESDEIKRRVAGLRGTLVRALRTAIYQIATQDPRSAVPRVLETLQARELRVYRRLELDLIRSFADDVPDLVEQYLADHEVLNIEPPLPEYTRLAEERFRTLAPTTQQQILHWIDEGLDSHRIAEAFRRSGHEPTAEDIAREARYLQWERLSPIRESLPADARERFEALAAEFGQPKGQAPKPPHERFIGPTSPMSVDELLELTSADLMAYLASWSSPGGFGVPTPEGLGRAVTVAVQQAPTRFAHDARSFSGLDPTYVRALIAGLRETKQADATFDWEAVLDLCLWVDAQPREIEGRDQNGLDADPSWGWTRKEIARLVADGLSPGPNEIPLALRRQVWSVLGPLTWDPDPTPEDEERYGGPDTNPLDYSLNTVRASAMEAVIRYGAWVRRHVAKGSTNGDEWQGFGTIPEVAEVLEVHLDPEHDPSAAIRSVFGQLLPWLIGLDAEWVRLQLPRLFPANADQVVLRDAVWETYVVVNAANRQTFELLLDEYRGAIARLPDGTSRWLWQGWTGPNKKLGEHLVTAYVWGWIELDDDTGLLRAFYEQALPDVRAHVAEWIGRELPRLLIRAGPPEITRLVALWEGRIAVAEAAEDATPYQAELSEFGWWFISGRFDDTWAIEQIVRVLRLSATPAFLFRVIARLAALAEQMPRATGECLDLLLGREEVSDLQLSASLEELNAIVAAALVANDDEARQLGRDAANRLSARGFVRFADLLKRQDHKVNGQDSEQNTL